MTDDEAVWDAGDCADFLKMSRKHFLVKIRFCEGFPAQLEWSKMGRPKWSAADVKGWALRRNYANAA